VEIAGMHNLEPLLAAPLEIGVGLTPKTWPWRVIVQNLAALLQRHPLPNRLPKNLPIWGPFQRRVGGPNFNQFQKTSSQSVHNFLSYPENKRTGRIKKQNNRTSL